MNLNNATPVRPAALIFAPSDEHGRATVPRGVLAFIEAGTGQRVEIEDADGQPVDSGRLGGPGDGSFNILDSFTLTYN